MKKLVNLTYPQKAILLTEQFYKNTAVNNICGTAIIDSVLDFDALNKAINIVVKENDIFRITLTKKSGEIKQFKTEYKENEVKVEENKIKYISNDEKKIEEFLNVLKENEVTPIALEDILSDFSKKTILI